MDHSFLHELHQRIPSWAAFSAAVEVAQGGAALTAKAEALPRLVARRIAAGEDPDHALLEEVQAIAQTTEADWTREEGRLKGAAARDDYFAAGVREARRVVRVARALRDEVIGLKLAAEDAKTIVRGGELPERAPMDRDGRLRRFA